MTNYMKLTAFMFVALMFYAAQPASAWYDAGFVSCMNITIEETDGVTRVTMPIIFNITGMTDKQPDSRDFRLVNTSCSLNGSAVDFMILSNTSTSVYIATTINATKNANTFYSAYWNASGKDTANNPTLFIYANNGTTAWRSDAGLKLVVGYSSANQSIKTEVPTGTNSFNLTNVSKTAGEIWFSHMINFNSRDIYGAGLGLGDDALGQGKPPFSTYTTNLIQYEDHYYCYDEPHAFVKLIDNNRFNFWYNVRVNLSFTTRNNTISVDEGATWVKCNFYLATGVVDAVENLKIFGNYGQFQLKDIFLGAFKFNSYNTSVKKTQGSIENYPAVPEANCSISFIAPTPPNGTNHGMDYNTVIGISISNTSAGDNVYIEWNGVNNSVIMNGATGVYNPAVVGGVTYRYQGIIVMGAVVNRTEQRTLFILGDTDVNISNRFDLSKLMWLLLFVVIGFLAWLVFR